MQFQLPPVARQKKLGGLFMKQRILSLILVFALCCGLLPAAGAADGDLTAASPADAATAAEPCRPITCLYVDNTVVYDINDDTAVSVAQTAGYYVQAESGEGKSQAAGSETAGNYGVYRGS